MARKKQTDIERAAAAGAAAAVAASHDQVMDLGEDDEPVSPDEVDFFRALRELDEGADISWTVHKLTGPPDERGFIEKLSSSQLDLQRFRDVYGPGEYRLSGLRNGQYVKGGRKTVKISAVAYQRPALTIPAPVKDTTATDLLAAMERREAERRAEFRSWAAILIPVFTPVVTSFFTRKPEGVKELIEGLAALQGLKPPTEKPETFESQLDKMTGALAKLKELAGDDNGKTGSTWVDLIRDVVKEAGPTLAQVGTALAMRRAMAPPMQRVMAPAGIPPTALPQPAGSPSATPPVPGTGDISSGAPPSAAPPGTTEGETMNLVTWLRALLEFLILKAAQDKDPELYAEVSFDDIPPSVNAADLRRFIERPDWWQQLTAFEPRLAPYQGWMARYRDALLELFEELAPAPKPEPPPPPAPAAEEEFQDGV